MGRYDLGGRYLVNAPSPIAAFLNGLSGGLAQGFQLSDMIRMSREARRQRALEDHQQGVRTGLMPEQPHLDVTTPSSASLDAVAGERPQLWSRGFAFNGVNGDAPVEPPPWSAASLGLRAGALAAPVPPPDIGALPEAGIPKRSRPGSFDRTSKSFTSALAPTPAPLAPPATPYRQGGIRDAMMDVMSSPAAPIGGERSVVELSDPRFVPLDKGHYLDTWRTPTANAERAQLAEHERQASLAAALRASKRSHLVTAGVPEAQVDAVLDMPSLADNVLFPRPEPAKPRWETIHDEIDALVAEGTPLTEATDTVRQRYGLGPVPKPRPRAVEKRPASTATAKPSSAGSYVAKRVPVLARKGRVGSGAPGLSVHDAVRQAREEAEAIYGPQSWVAMKAAPGGKSGDGSVDLRAESPVPGVGQPLTPTQRATADDLVRRMKDGRATLAELRALNFHPGVIAEVQRRTSGQ